MNIENQLVKLLNTNCTLEKKPNYYKMSKGIKSICQLLSKLQVVYSTEVHFGNACHHWRPLPFDIMIVIKGKIGLIEYDGYQHFHYKCEFTKTKEDLINQQTKDLLKTIFTKKNSISLLRISYDCNEEKIQKYLMEFLEFLNTQLDPIYIFSNHELYKDHVKICLT